MKFRYFLLPILIVSLMIFTLNGEEYVIDKKMVSGINEISYPFFYNDSIDKYISDYLNEYSDKDNILIDYDYFDIGDKYYLTFYKSVISNDVVDTSSDSFIVDTVNNRLSKSENVFYRFDFVTNKSIDTSKKFVALTFDDGPNYNTNKVIDILNKYNVKATFFVLGSEINGNEDILIKMKNSGMEIGNHTFNHLLLTRYSEDKIRNEISNTSDLIYNVIGKRPNLLRPSYGSFNKKIKKVADYPIIIWNVDTLDWKYHNSKKITSRVVNNVKDGDIILMHDIYSATSNSLNSIIPMLKQMGYEFVTIPELFYYKGISLENGKIYGSAR